VVIQAVVTPPMITPKATPSISSSELLM